MPFTGISACNEPLVPKRTIFNDFCIGFNSRVIGLILTAASSSFITMSILSVPIPVESTVILLPLKSPV